MWRVISIQDPEWSRLFRCASPWVFTKLGLFSKRQREIFSREVPTSGMSFSAQPRPETPQHERASQGAIIVLATIPAQTHNGNTKVPNRSESNFPRTTPHTIDLVCPWWNNRYDEKAFSPARSIKTGGSQEYPPFIPIFSKGVRS